jgi:DNA-binding NtrC family response regulator
VRQTLQAILQDEFDVLDVADGHAAVEMVRAAAIDLVLLDVVLPGVNGLTVLDQLQGVRPGIRVVMISGVNQAAPAATAIRHGAIDYVTKPFDVNAILVLRAS